MKGKTKFGPRVWVTVLDDGATWGGAGTLQFVTNRAIEKAGAGEGAPEGATRTIDLEAVPDMLDALKAALVTLKDEYPKGEWKHYPAIRRAEAVIEAVEGHV